MERMWNNVIDLLSPLMTKGPMNSPRPLKTLTFHLAVNHLIYQLNQLLFILSIVHKENISLTKLIDQIIYLLFSHAALNEVVIGRSHQFAVRQLLDIDTENRLKLFIYSLLKQSVLQ